MVYELLSLVKLRGSWRECVRAGGDKESYSHSGGGGGGRGCRGRRIKKELQKRGRRGEGELSRAFLHSSVPFAHYMYLL